MAKFIEPTDLKVKAIDVIKNNNLIFIEDVCAMIGVNKSTFYNKFPVDDNDYNELSSLLEANKINLKVSLRKNWASQTQNATMQMALYKLCSTSEEHKKLQQNYTDLTSKDEQLNTTPTIVFKDYKNGD